MNTMILQEPIHLSCGSKKIGTLQFAYVDFLRGPVNSIFVAFKDSDRINHQHVSMRNHDYNDHGGLIQ